MRSSSRHASQVLGGKIQRSSAQLLLPSQRGEAHCHPLTLQRKMVSIRVNSVSFALHEHELSTNYAVTDLLPGWKYRDRGMMQPPEPRSNPTMELLRTHQAADPNWYLLSCEAEAPNFRASHIAHRRYFTSFGVAAPDSQLLHTISYMPQNAQCSLVLCLLVREAFPGANLSAGRNEPMHSDQELTERTLQACVRPCLLLSARRGISCHCILER